MYVNPAWSERYKKHMTNRRIARKALVEIIADDRCLPQTRLDAIHDLEKLGKNDTFPETHCVSWHTPEATELRRQRTVATRKRSAETLKKRRDNQKRTAAKKNIADNLLSVVEKLEASA